MKWRRKGKQSGPTPPPKTVADLADENRVIRLGGAGGGPGQAGQPGKHARLEIGPDGKARLTVDESGGGQGGSA